MASPLSVVVVPPPSVAWRLRTALQKEGQPDAGEIRSGFGSYIRLFFVGKHGAHDTGAAACHGGRRAVRVVFRSRASNVAVSRERLGGCASHPFEMPPAAENGPPWGGRRDRGVARAWAGLAASMRAREGFGVVPAGGSRDGWRARCRSAACVLAEDP